MKKKRNCTFFLNAYMNKTPIILHNIMYEMANVWKRRTVILLRSVQVQFVIKQLYFFQYTFYAYLFYKALSSFFKRNEKND